MYINKLYHGMLAELSPPQPCLDNSKIGMYVVILHVSKFLNPIQIEIDIMVEVLPSALQLCIELPCWPYDIVVLV